MSDLIEKQCKTCSHWQGTICEYRPWPTGEACADWEVDKPTADLINRQTAINTLLKAYPLMQKEKLVEVMETVPAEVIRCKDCKYSSDNRVYGCRIESFNYGINTRMYSDGFCSKSERRTDG